MSTLLDLVARLVCYTCGHDRHHLDPLANSGRCSRCLRPLRYFDGRWWSVTD